ncbi:interferon-induced transmembrane protein 3 [Ictalurus punctatus]|uniref:Interferon-induced transmembrane protein 3 n=1 Tax=Ictalurus punctatus TaxID=7998 RepID=A0A2D0SCL6_ICTPU|nr:interferon-induced transmembrane protein 3 [Ictalurus punctatus]
MQSSMVPLNAPLDAGRGAGTVVVVMPDHPPDYIVWSMASIIYGNPCCLGLIAFYYSIKSRNRKMVGDMTGAMFYASKAQSFNGWALTFIIITIILLIVLMVVVNAQLLSSRR